MKRTIIILACLISAIGAYAQKDFGEVARFDGTVYDFGKVNIRDGAVKHSFTVSNIGTEVLNIQVVVSTCSCTSAVWTKSDIAPGASGTIDVTYSNDEGPYPFDKTLTVYLSNLEKPVILHIKGTSYKGKKK